MSGQCHHHGVLKCRFPGPAPKASSSGVGPRDLHFNQVSQEILVFIFNFWLCWVFIAAGAFLLLRCMGFSLQWVLLLGSTGTRACGFQ